MATALTRDIDGLFFPRLDEVAADLSAPGAPCAALDLMKVSYSESGCRSDAWNHNGDASGIIGFMPPILRGLGWKDTPAAFRMLSATDQLEYLRRYYLPHKGKLASVGAVYVATFLPALLSHATDPDYTLTAKANPLRERDPEERLGWAFAPNAVFDRNHDLAITVRELEDAVARNCRGPRWAELAERLAGTETAGMPQVDPLISDDLRTTAGIQTALERLGFSPGDIDGIPGPRTRAAAAAFQRHAGIGVDGIVGPITRKALEAELLTRE